MTREEAVKWLKTFKGNTGMTELSQAFDVAIAALSAEPCYDAISRQAMHIALEKWIIYGEYKYSNATKYLYDRIDRLPSVNPQEPKTGHWIENDIQEHVELVYHCDQCGNEAWGEYEKTPFCSNCGAKMF